ncbi:uncharacterized protein JN550_008234 [Neoarthrinium moseri]|uniref:uncharacterized protein n=1 Tax=Neoarthrinium moseri TaxID=1658444 RepID=UPI001FDBD947|nr:uncharacterized protein JN550_008234 [Neoarthrinium moseri]KAI1865477.1 hypothetical protein JN550_008234 [Neoarthrinium moseri]
MCPLAVPIPAARTVLCWPILDLLSAYYHERISHLRRCVLGAALAFALGAADMCRSEHAHLQAHSTLIAELALYTVLGFVAEWRFGLLARADAWLARELADLMYVVEDIEAVFDIARKMRVRRDGGKTWKDGAMVRRKTWKPRVRGTRGFRRGGDWTSYGDESDLMLWMKHRNQVRQRLMKAK